MQARTIRPPRSGIGTRRLAGRPYAGTFAVKVTTLVVFSSAPRRPVLAQTLTVKTYLTNITCHSPVSFRTKS